MRRMITLVLFSFLFSALMPSLLPTAPGIGSLVWADVKDDQLKTKLKTHRDRLLNSLKDVPGGQWYGKANACEVWRAMDESQQKVFLTHTDLLGQRSLLNNYPFEFTRLEAPYGMQFCVPTGECTEFYCEWVDEDGYCRSTSGWDCYNHGRCWVDRLEPKDFTMAIEHVNRLLWVAGSCPWPKKWVSGGICVDGNNRFVEDQSCTGEDNNRIYYEAQDPLIQKFRNFAQGLPMWDKSNDPGGAHMGFTHTSETLHGRRSDFMATGQTHFYARDDDPNKWDKGHTLWWQFCNARNMKAACNGSEYAPEWASRMVEQDLDYSFPWHESSPVCHYGMGQGYQQYNKVWTNQVTANDAAYDYDPCNGYSPTPSNYTLTVSKSGSSSSAVTSTPSYINCGNTCSVSLPANTQVTLAATPGSGSMFMGWSGACSGKSSCTVTLDTAKSVAASFAEALQSLTVSKSGTGSGIVTSNPGTINCGGACTAAFNAFSQVTLTAWPDGGYSFAGWSGACSGTGSCTVTMDAAKSVTATFSPAGPHVDRVVESETNGSTINTSSYIRIYGSNFSVGGNRVQLQRSGYPDVWLFEGDGHFYFDREMYGREMLARLDGRAAAGTWTLTVKDSSGRVSNPYTLYIQEYVKPVGAYYCNSSLYPNSAYSAQFCSAAHRPTFCYTVDWQPAACPGTSSVCGNGICEAGENGSNCPQDCCDQSTPCGQTKQNQGVYYCRNMYYLDNGIAYYHGWQWLTANDTSQLCNDWWEAQEGALYQTRYRCGNEEGRCQFLPGGYRKY